MTGKEKNELEILRAKEEKRKERIKRQNDTFNASVDRITFTVQKGKKAEVQAAAAAAGLSVNAWLQSVVFAAIEKQ